MLINISFPIMQTFHVCKRQSFDFSLNNNVNWNSPDLKYLKQNICLGQSIQFLQFAGSFTAVYIPTGLEMNLGKLFLQELPVTEMQGVKRPDQTCWLQCLSRWCTNTIPHSREGERNRPQDYLSCNKPFASWTGINQGSTTTKAAHIFSIGAPNPAWIDPLKKKSTSAHTHNTSQICIQ